MGKMIVKEKFPCGYEYQIEISGWLASANVHNKDGCPLHGKKCLIPKKKK